MSTTYKTNRATGKASDLISDSWAEHAYAVRFTRTIEGQQKISRYIAKDVSALNTALKALGNTGVDVDRHF